VAGQQEQIRHEARRSRVISGGSVAGGHANQLFWHVFDLTAG
jgi:hypothetical protein